jgi:hypothetical protein
VPHFAKPAKQARWMAANLQRFFALARICLLAAVQCFI